MTRTRTEAWLAFLIVSMVGIVAMAAAPTRETPKDAPPPPDLRGVCQFGKIEQHDDEFTIVGPFWEGSGQIHAGGVVTMNWFSGKFLEGREAWASYKIDGRTLKGEWWFDDEPTAKMPETIEIRGSE